MTPPTNCKSAAISGRLLTRNWAFNLLGWAVPISVAFIAIPYVIHGLGAERFGVLSLASALLGYFGIFDLGLGRATTKFVAESLAHGDALVLPKVVWTALWSELGFGILGTLATASLIPLTVDRFLKISPALIAETRTSLLVLSMSLCIVLTGNALRAVLEAGQMFNIVNYVKVPTNTAMFLMPAVGVFLHLNLPAIMWLLVGARLAATVAYFAACLRFFPGLKDHYLPDRHRFRPLFVYGGWVTLSNLITPLLAYTDRFIIGSLVSMNAVGYYSAPADVLYRAWVVPDTLAATLFPAFTNLDVAGYKHRLEELCARSLKALLLISVPTLLLLTLFARQLLRWWLGAEFATQSAAVLQILTLGMLMRSLALVPSSLLQGVGRPDLTGIFSLLELVFQVASCYVLVRNFGILGAALAWTLRALLDALLTFGAVFWTHSISVRTLLQNGIQRTLLVVLALAAAFMIVWRANAPLLTQTAIAALLVLAFTHVSWTYLLDTKDKDLLADTVAQVRFAFARSKRLSVESQSTPA